jgi:hypothetical protein
VTPGCLLIADDEGAELGSGEPGGNSLPQDASAVLACPALASDNKDCASPAGLAVAQERDQSMEGALLSHSVQINAPVDLGEAAR